MFGSTNRISHRPWVACRTHLESESVSPGYPSSWQGSFGGGTIWIERIEVNLGLIHLTISAEAGIARVIHAAVLTGDSIRRAGIIHLVAALCSPVWQNRKRTSFKPLLKANLPDMIAMKAISNYRGARIGRWGYRLSGRRCPTGRGHLCDKQASGGGCRPEAPPGI